MTTASGKAHTLNAYLADVDPHQMLWLGQVMREVDGIRQVGNCQFAYDSQSDIAELIKRVGWERARKVREYHTDRFKRNTRRAKLHLGRLARTRFWRRLEAAAAGDCECHANAG